MIGSQSTVAISAIQKCIPMNPDSKAGNRDMDTLFEELKKLQNKTPKFLVKVLENKRASAARISAANVWLALSDPETPATSRACFVRLIQSAFKPVHKPQTTKGLDIEAMAKNIEESL